MHGPRHLLASRASATRPNRQLVLHLTIIGLLVFSVAQVVWWFYDQRHYAEATANQVRLLYSRDLIAAQKLADLGVAAPEITAMFPPLEIRDGNAAVSPAALAKVDQAQHQHVKQYAWESGFFLLVQAFAIAVLLGGLSSEARVRRRQDNLLALVSHQFKTSLASLQLSLETMLLRQPSAERARQLSRRMLDDLRRMENMVSKILDSARLDRGHVRLTRQRLFLDKVVRHTVAALDELARRENIVVSVAVPSGLQVHADPIAVDGVLRNLIENAIAAMAPMHGGTLSIIARSTRKGVQLEVQDTGIGFDPAQAPRLFEEFFRLDTTGGRDAAGTGLGLYIVKRFMHFDRGDVRAQSAGAGRGATFTVTWPAIQES